LALCLLEACTQNSSPSATFAIGGADDPVLQMALTQMPNATVQLIVRNSGSQPIAEGLVTTEALFTAGQAPSSDLAAFASGGDAAALAASLSTRSFLVPAVPANGSAAVTVDVPRTSRVRYTSRSGSELVATNAAVAIFDNVGQPVAVEVDLFHFTVSASSVSSNGPRVGSKLTVGNLAKCVVQTGMPMNVDLMNDDFSAGQGVESWPHGYGYSGTFGGAWYTDGITARVYNPNWGGADANAPLPTVSGFVKFIDVCPGPNSTIDVTASVLTQFSSQEADTTLVVYFFDENNALLSVTTNYPTAGRNDGLLGIYDAVLPAGTRRIGVVPMVELTANEQGSAYYDWLKVRYEPAHAWQKRELVRDDMSHYGASAYGDQQPNGWAEFGGDWYVFDGGPEGAAATVWNPAWGGDQTKRPPIDTGMLKTFALGDFAAGDLLDVQMFGAATLTDDASFLRLRVEFDDPASTAFDSRRLATNAYGDVKVRRVPIPAGAAHATVIVNAFLAKNETSALYIDDVVARIDRPMPLEGGIVSPVQATARPYDKDIVNTVRLLGSDLPSYFFQTNDLPGLMDVVSTRLSETQSLSDIGGAALDARGVALVADAPVRVYFLGEGAGYRNTLGFNSDGSPGQGSGSKLIFPDASAQGGWLAPGSGVGPRTLDQPLMPGDFVDLGRFTAGTALQFFLVSDGASGGRNVYTVAPASNPDRRPHVVAFTLEDSPYVIIGFEDLYGGGDNDFNDAVFAVDIGYANVAALRSH
jgi:Domain of unknown function (DUF4114)